MRYRLVAPEGAVDEDGWRAAMRLPAVGMEGESRVMASFVNMAKRAGVELNFVVKCSSWISVASVLSGSAFVGVLPNILEIPAGHREVTSPGMNAAGRKLVLAWDGRRGSLRARSVSWRQVLEETLRF